MIINEEVANDKRVFDEGIELKDNAMLKRRPELFHEWDFELNDELGLDVYKATYGSEKLAWWNCPDCKTPYDMDLKSRAGRGTGKTKGTNCPYCAGKRINWTNSLASLRPDLAKEWHTELNNELTPGGFTCNSGEKVWWLCPECESPYDMVINDRSGVKNSNCSYCAGKRVNHTNSLASLYPDLASEWHPTLNGGMTPSDKVGGSHETIWWLGGCNHHWEAAIEDRTKESGTGCPYCVHNPKILIGFNDMWTTNPELAKMLMNPEDGYKYMQSSSVRVDWKCLECENIIPNRAANKVVYKGLSCPRCSDGISFGEKFIYNLLKEHSIKFDFDKSQTWSLGKRYDFYLPEYDAIIEVHGMQHYEKGFEGLGGRSLLEEQENDKLKEKLANENGNVNYIVIDARYSTVEWIKNSILNSDIMNIVEYLNFERIGQLASKSLVKEACDLWMFEMRNTSKISRELKLSQSTILTYLRRGAEIGWCDYSTKEVKRIASSLSGKKSAIPVVQLSMEGGFIKEWSSASEASIHINNKRSSKISCVCRRKRNSSMGFKWMYKEDYDKLTASSN